MVKNLPAMWKTQVRSLVLKIPWRSEWQPTPVFLSGESRGERSLVGYSPWGCKEWDTTEWWTLSLSLILYGLPGGSVVKSLPANTGNMGLIPGSGWPLGRGNCNPPQSSCLGNPMDREASWATIHEVAKELDMTLPTKQQLL